MLGSLYAPLSVCMGVLIPPWMVALRAGPQTVPETMGSTAIDHELEIGSELVDDGLTV